jgi:Predicted permeases
MLRIRRLYLFMLETFLPLLAMTFGICLFIVLMQFLWRYIDDVVGKGLSMSVILEMLFYMALSLVPTALPLSILLAAIMTFGNLGERLELLAMKSAGISLIHIMRPLIVTLVFVSVGAFFFQNNVLPIAQSRLYTLLYSIRSKSPELEIPEGVFYKEITGYNVYVRKKDNTGLLKDLMIYDYSQGFEKVSVMVADSGRLKMSADKLFLVLSLFDGESFENLQTREAISAARRNEAVPYKRETFVTKDILIEFDANFNRADEAFMQNNQYMGKNLNDLQIFIDSMAVQLDSLRDLHAGRLVDGSYKRLFVQTKQRHEASKLKGNEGEPEVLSFAIPQDVKVIDFDSLYNEEGPGVQAAILGRVKSSLENTRTEYYFKSLSMKDESYKLRRHLTEWHSKFTLSFSCMIFFFIGAPLGAIIRKGGLGMPVVLSVIFFIFYYIVNNIGFKMARDGIWSSWEGMWLSSAVLTPIGVFLTYKAVNDSTILNSDTYINAIKNLFGKRSVRNIGRKEVIIYDPDYNALIPKLAKLKDDCKDYHQSNKRWMNYFRLWKNGGKDSKAESISVSMEAIVEELANSDQNLILNKLMDLPVIAGYNVLKIDKIPKLDIIMSVLFPIGIPVYLMMAYQRKLLLQDMRVSERVCGELITLIEEYNNKTI